MYALVAAKWWMVRDRPVKDLLGNIKEALIQRLLESNYGGDESAVPTIDYLAVESKAVPKTLLLPLFKALRTSTTLYAASLHLGLDR